MPSISCVDLFCGAGGLTRGRLHRVGHSLNRSAWFLALLDGSFRQETKLFLRNF